MTKHTERLEKVALTLAGITSWNDLPTPAGQHDVTRYREGMIAHYQAMAARCHAAYSENKAIASDAQALKKWDHSTGKELV